MCAQPSRPKFVVRVGVTGHREGAGLDSEGLLGSIRAALEQVETKAREIFEQSRDFFDEEQEQPVLRFISSLADGADRLVAQVALARGYELQVPLPLSLAQYPDIDSKSKAEFQSLLSQANTVFQLDHPHATDDERKEAYEASGRLMLRQSDVLIAVWDGQPARGVGGTGQIVQEARAAEIPTLRIDTKTHALTLLSARQTASGKNRDGGCGEDQSVGELLRERFAQTFLSHSGEPKQIAEVEEAARRFFSPRKRFQWKSAQELPPKLQHDGDAVLRSAFEWADNHANRYAFAYRWSYRLIYSLGALAVLLAYLGSTAENLPEGFPREHNAFLAAELIAILVIGILATFGRLWGWHERWLDYRHLAESLRMTRLLVLVGRVTSNFQIPAHLGKGDPRKTWFHSYLRSLVRQVGLVKASLDEPYRASFRDFLYQNILGQEKYHEGKVARCHLTQKVWHNLAQALFGIAAIACLLHFRVHGENSDPYVLALNLAVIVLPAFGAAIGAILYHGESERILRRSKALEERLESLEAEILAHKDQIPSARELGLFAEDFSRICLAELMDWRFLFLDRPLVLPA